VGAAAGLGQLFAATGGPAPPARPWEPRAAVAAFTVGVVVTVVSAHVPARRASRVPPVPALRTGEPAPPASLRRRNTVGALVTAVGGLLVASVAGQEDLAPLVFAGAVLMAGLIVLTPLITLGATTLLRRPLVRLTGVHGRLA